MSKNNDVFELIKSLTKNEKRFFKIFSKRHSDNNDLKYLQLFDIYDSFLAYNKSEIDKEIHKKRLTNTRYLKHQLNLQILRCLNTYHYQKNIEIEVSNLLQNSQILFEKGLFNQAYKLVNQAKLIAKKYDLKLLLLECLKKEKNIARELYKKEIIEYFSNTGFNDEKQIINEYLEACKTHSLRNQLILISRESYNIPESELAAKTKLLKTQILALKTDTNQSFEIKEINMVTQAYFYLFTQEYNNADQIQEQILSLYRSHPEQLELHLLGNISNLYNSLVANFIQKKYQKVEPLLDAIDKYRFQPTNRLINLKLFTYLNIGLAYYNKKGDFARSSSYEKNISEELVRFSSSVHIFAKISLHLHLIVCFIGLRDFEKANYWASKAISNLSSNSILTHLLIAKILALIIAFEQKKYTYLNFLAKQFLDEIIESKNNLKSLHTIISFFCSVHFDRLTKKETFKVLEQLKQDLIIVFGDEDENVIFDAFDILSWIDSIILNQSYGHLVKKKFDLGL